MLFAKYVYHTLVLITTSVFEISTLELKDACRAKAPLGRLPGSARTTKCYFVKLLLLHNIVWYSQVFLRGQGGRVVTLSPPTSEAGVRSP